MTEQEQIDKVYKIIDELNKKATMFGKGMLVLSLLDCLFGLLALAFSSLAAIAVFMSASSLTAIVVCGRVIQINKVMQLQKSLRPLNTVAVAWFITRYKKYLNKGSKIKMTKSTVLQKILTSVLAVFGVGGLVVGLLPQFAPIASGITNIVAMISEGIATVSGLWLAGTSDKVLTEEEKAAIEKKRAEKEEVKKLAEVEKAKAELERIEKLKQLVAEADAKKDNTEVK